MADYKYVLRRIKDFAVMGELACSEVSFSYALNGYGEGSFTVPMADTIGDPFGWTIPKRFVICVERNGALAWSGPIWSRTRDYGKRTIRFAANEWGSIWDRFFIRNADYDYDTAKSYLVLEGLTNSVTSVLPAVTNPVQDYTAIAGTPLDNYITGVFPQSDHAKVIDCIDTLAASADGGFEYFWTQDYDSAGLLRWRMHVGSPLGTPPFDAAQPIYEFYAPGQNGASAATSTNPSSATTVMSYTVDDHESANELQAFDADGYLAATLIALYPGTVNDPMRTDEAATFPGLDDDQILDRANLYFDMRGGGYPVNVYRMRLYIPDPLPAGANSGGLGDWIKFIHQDSAGATPVDAQARLVGQTISVGADGVESIEVTLNGVAG